MINNFINKFKDERLLNIRKIKEFNKKVDGMYKTTAHNNNEDTRAILYIISELTKIEVKSNLIDIYKDQLLF